MGLTSHGIGRLSGSEPHDKSVLVPIDALRGSLSPREIQVTASHVLVLVDAIDRLPPISVHAGTMAVIDGVHRVAAHRQLGRREIAAVLFEGELSLALLLAIRANVTHGLPLSLSERREAAAQVLRDHADRSDRWIADMCGLSHVTVGKLRHRTLGGDASSPRVGRDGRTRANPRVQSDPGAGAAQSRKADRPAACAAVESLASPRVEGSQRPLEASVAKHDEYSSIRQELDQIQPTLTTASVVARIAGSFSAASLVEVERECVQRATFWNSLAQAVSDRQRGLAVPSPRH
jgi:ParB-like chromosome segregation protein Spo0J